VFGYSNRLTCTLIEISLLLLCCACFPLNLTHNVLYMTLKTFFNKLSTLAVTLATNKFGLNHFCQRGDWSAPHHNGYLTYWAHRTRPEVTAFPLLNETNYLPLQMDFRIMSHKYKTFFNTSTVATWNKTDHLVVSYPNLISMLFLQLQ